MKIGEAAVAGIRDDNQREETVQDRERFCRELDDERAVLN
jgi:hypothetical protein